MLDWVRRARAYVSSSLAMRPPSRLTSDALKNRLAIVRDVFFIAALSLFFTGWLFAYFYFSHFGIALHSIEIPIFHYYFYSINVIQYAINDLSIVSWLLVALVAAFGALMFGFFPSLVSLALLALWFWVGFYATQDAALDATDYVRSGRASAVEFEFRQDQDLARANVAGSGSTAEACADLPEHVGRLCRGNLENRLFLLAQTREYFIVFFKPERPFQAAPEPRGFVYHIPSAEVSAAVTLPSIRR